MIQDMQQQLQQARDVIATLQGQMVQQATDMRAQIAQQSNDITTLQQQLSQVRPEHRQEERVRYSGM